MDKIIFIVAFLATIIFSVNICAAQDTWVDHLKKGNVDLYVMDDTINAGPNQDYFSVTVKSVKKNKIFEIVNWKFSKRKTAEWHYETVTRDSHDSVLTAPNGIFEFCMKQLGWAYRVEGGNYY